MRDAISARTAGQSRAEIATAMVRTMRTRTLAVIIKLEEKASERVRERASERERRISSSVDSESERI